VTVNISPTIDWLRNENEVARLILQGQTLALLDAAGLVNRGRVDAVNVSAISGQIVNHATGQIIVATGDRLYLTGPTVSNDGAISVHPSGSGDAKIRIDAPDLLSGAGELVFGGNSIGDEIYSDAGAALTQAAGHTIHGWGAIRCPFINEGTVRADNQTFWISGTPSITNRALLTATGGATLQINGVAVDNAGGRVFADGGTVRLGGGARIAGGTLERSGASMIQVGGNPVYLEDVTVAPGGWCEVLIGCIAVWDGSSIVNDGTIRVHPPGTSGDASIRIDAPVTLSGSGEVVFGGNSTGDGFYSDVGATLTQAAGHTIRGWGQIVCPFVNEGSVVADNSTLWISAPASVANRSLMTATGGAVLDITSVAVDNTGGRIVADGGTVLLGTGTRLAGGTIDRTGTSVVRVDGSDVRLADVTVAPTGWCDVYVGAIAVWDGSTVVNDGAIRVNQGTGGDAKIRIDRTVHLSGSGTVLLDGNSDGDGFFTLTDSMLVQEAGHTITGLGEIACPFVNRGTVRRDVASGYLKVSTARFLNEAFVEATNGGQVQVTVPPLNFANGTLTGGTWRAAGGAKIRLIGTDVTTNAATIILDGAGSAILRDVYSGSALATLGTNDAGGSLSIVNGATLATTTPVESRGAIVLDGGTYSSTGVLTLTGGSLSGVGTVDANTVNGAEIIVGTSIGTIAVDGVYEQTAAGTLTLELGGTEPGDSDLLAVTGRATLDGLVSYSLVNGYVPALAARPAAGGALLDLDLPWSAEVSLRLYDVAGRQVAVLAEGRFGPGRHTRTIGIDGRAPASGVYFARAIVRTEKETKLLTARAVCVR